MSKIIKLTLCICIPLLIGGIGGFATIDEVKGWYLTLHKPSFNPPNYLFGPVWTSLYVLMGISFYLILTAENKKHIKKAWGIYGVQLLLNLTWSFLFFKFHWVGLAFIEVLMMWISILFMIIIFYRIDKKAAYLQIPYLIWVSFASLLNGAIWALN